MIAMAAAMAVSAPLAVTSERGWFHIPGADDFRMQTISRADNELDWPFAVDEGYLLCAWVLGERVVYFGARPEDDDDERLARVIVVSGNPLDIMLSGVMDRDLIAPYVDIAQLVTRFAPFETMGRRLCDQPRGSQVGPGEL